MTHRAMRCSPGAAAIVAAALSGLSTTAISADLGGSIALGRMFAQSYCSPCHAIGRTGASPHAPAPPFRTLHERYDVEGLADAFAEGIAVGHTGVRRMPEFMLNPEQIDNLLAYLKSLEPPKRAPAKRAPANSPR